MLLYDDNTLKAQHLITVGNNAQAQKFLVKALADEPDNAAAHAYMAVCLLNEGQNTEAEKFCKQALQSEPEYAYAHYVYALIKNNLYEFKQGIISIKKALELDPEDEDFFETLALLNINLKNYHEASVAISAGLEINPENHRLLLQKAKLQSIAGNNKQAQESINQSLSINPENEKALIMNGWMAFDQGDYKRADEIFTDALRTNPLSSEAREGLLETKKSNVWFYRIFLKDGFAKYNFKPKGTQILYLILAIQILPIIIAGSALVLIWKWYCTVLYESIIRLGKISKYLLTPGKVLRSNVFLALNAASILLWLIAFIFGYDWMWKLFVLSVVEIFPVIAMLDVDDPSEKKAVAVSIIVIAVLMLIFNALPVIFFALVAITFVAIFGLMFSLRVFE